MMLILVQRPFQIKFFQIKTVRLQVFLNCIENFNKLYLSEIFFLIRDNFQKKKFKKPFKKIPIRSIKFFFYFSNFYEAKLKIKSL